ncbi:O-acetyl-ADP-ribose deacetylase [bacterium]|nr:O-acetyl-ADP-ribose deacetylase [candidate division CSSED10-310 bacterium]
MRLVIGHRSVRLVQGDITVQTVDAIVTAANSGLRGGGGVDGAVHRAAGPELLEACRAIGHCPTGSAVITPAFNLEAEYVIHAVGPIWSGGNRNEAALLAGAYHSSLALAENRGCASLAFPSISTGVYGYPVDLAAPIALQVITSFLADSADHLERVFMVLFDGKTLKAYQEAAVRMSSGE